jgi:hypothetical protein
MGERATPTPSSGPPDSDEPTAPPETKARTLPTEVVLLPGTWPPGRNYRIADLQPRHAGTVLAVRPWQLRTVIGDRYAAARNEGIVVPIPGYSQPVAPLLSLRNIQGGEFTGYTYAG